MDAQYEQSDTARLNVPALASKDNLLMADFIFSLDNHEQADGHLSDQQQLA